MARQLIQASDLSTRDFVIVDSNGQKKIESTQTAKIGSIEAKLNNLKIGGRNLVLNSKQTLRTLDASNSDAHKIQFSIAQDVDFSRIDEIVLSCLIKYNDIAKAGSKWWRIGIEAKVVLDNNLNQYPSAWIFANDGQPASHNARYSYSWRVPKDRRIKSIEYAAIAIQYVSSSGEMVVADPMLQIGNTATDWQPAPEDAQVTITALEARIAALESRFSNGTIGD